MGPFLCPQKIIWVVGGREILCKSSGAKFFPEVCRCPKIESEGRKKILVLEVGYATPLSGVVAVWWAFHFRKNSRRKIAAKTEAKKKRNGFFQNKVCVKKKTLLARGFANKNLPSKGNSAPSQESGRRIVKQLLSNQQ